MKRLVGQGFAVVAVGVLGTAFTPACAENDQSIFIRSALAPAQNRQNNVCLYANDPTQPALAEGMLDVGIRENYIAVLLVGSQLIARGDATSTRAESNRAHIHGAVVQVKEPNGGLIGEFTSLATGFIDPQLNNAPSYGSVSIVAIDPPTMAKIAEGLTAAQTKLVVAHIKAFGETGGGVDLESGEYQLPIRVCNGCLVSFASGDDPAAPGVDCNLPLEGTAGGTSSRPCFPGQDEVTPCQTCLERAVCRTR